jgi:tetratricopeptide (TPR) repeat protein
MLADLLGVSVAVVRRWQRRGLIRPVREVHRLAYFDFQEVAAARRLAELLASGVSPQRIQRQLASLRRMLPDIERPLAQLSVIVQGRDILLRQGDGLIDSAGQMRFDFEKERQEPSSVERKVEPRKNAPEDFAAPSSAEELRLLAAQYLLYRRGDLPAARERYYMAVELDADYVEARANLGCVLAELGQAELAAAAFEGALQHHGEYPDAHFHLARILNELGRDDEAEPHWRAFLDLAPESPWAEDARGRLAT